MVFLCFSKVSKGLPGFFPWFLRGFGSFQLGISTYDEDDPTSLDGRSLGRKGLRVFGDPKPKKHSELEVLDV